MELSPTAYVILGFLGWGPMSGYDIKAAVDRSTRFFWAASYGQIYPELRRLADLGLVEGTSSPQGNRRRTLHRLTGAGREQLERWLASAPETFELRDEGLLKLFFADASAAGDAAAMLEAKAARHDAVVTELREIEPMAAAGGGSPYLTLRFGIDFNEWVAGWCRAERERLGTTPPTGAATNAWRAR